MGPRNTRAQGEVAGGVHRRLMDLLAGWERFVRSCAEADEPDADELVERGITLDEWKDERVELAREADELHAAYVSVGGCHGDDVELDARALDFVRRELVELVAGRGK